MKRSTTFFFKSLLTLVILFSFVNCPKGGGKGPLLLPPGETAEAPNPDPTIRVYRGSGIVTSVPDSSTENLGSVKITQSSTARVFTIQNNGEQTLNLTSTPVIAKTGAEAAQFTVDQSGTDNVLDPGETTEFTVTFSPSGSTGTKSAQLQIASNDPNTPSFILNLSGTANPAPAPDIQVKRGSTTFTSGSSVHTFTSVQENTSGTAVSFTINNIGDATLNLSSIALSGTNANQYTLDTSGTSNTVAASGSTTFSVTFSPTSTGVKTATITIPSDDAGTPNYTFGLSGTGNPTPVPEINVQRVTGSVNIADGSGSFDFGSQVENVAGSAVQFRIQNLGTASLSLTGTPIVEITGTNANQFEVTVQPSTTSVASAGNTTFSVRFVPTSTGAKTASISIANNDSDENPYDFTITGTGTPTPAPEINLKQASTSIASSGTYSGIADTRIGTTGATTTFTVENTGTATLNLSGTPRVVVGGTDSSLFTVASQPSATVAASGTSTFTVTFSPTSTGTKTATLTIANNDSDESSYVINLSANGVEPSAPCFDISTQSVTSNLSTVANYGGSGQTLYYSSTKPITIGPSFPAAIYYINQPHSLTSTLFGMFSGIYNSTQTALYETRDGVGLTNFSGLLPYGTTSSQFLNLLGGSGAITITPNVSQTIYFDINSPVSFSATNASYSIIRGCHARLNEERTFTTTSGTTNTSGLSKVWTYRKKLNIRFIFVQGSYPTYTVAGLQDAVNRITNIYAQDSVKIDVQFSATSVSASEFLDLTDFEDETGTLASSLTKLYTTTGSAQDANSLNIFLTSDTSNSNYAGLLGMAAGIPGVPGIVATKKAGMIVLIEPHRNSGSAGTALNTSDQQFLGDTIAHEAGHFLGLFHTNERGGASSTLSMFGLNARDALIETPYCLSSQDINADGFVSISECSGSLFTNSGALNLMFWAGDGVTSQTQLTGEQGWILRSNPLAY
ncbi:choice-of-anchor D domain-containing protein [Leptospira selangorensis]|uniref:Choice-of-anchor D domain-containing protein n=1 Tax=Leptospira selangorensis TaxID=2484982 RepID=A0A5F2BZD0_9LEPT|nr:choice-of-anchor D domain-containing protein [Leptospira selangorensis]TGM15867.1 choice-of-anchor D domain-containing protein [Leptospira selangorensis]TGM18184.1 choice-of-anchor D domain-containing protein [Leptospira selangorensis]